MPCEIIDTWPEAVSGNLMGVCLIDPRGEEISIVASGVTHQVTSYLGNYSTVEKLAITSAVEEELTRLMEKRQDQEYV